MRNEKPKQNKYSHSTPGKPLGGQPHTTRPREKGAEKSSSRTNIVQTDSYLDELKNDLMAFFQINEEQSFTQEQVLDHFGTSDRRMKLIMHGMIGELTDEGPLCANRIRATGPMPMRT